MTSLFVVIIVWKSRKNENENLIGHRPYIRCKSQKKKKWPHVCYRSNPLPLNFYFSSCTWKNSRVYSAFLHSHYPWSPKMNSNYIIIRRWFSMTGLFQMQACFLSIIDPGISPRRIKIQCLFVGHWCHGLDPDEDAPVLASRENNISIRRGLHSKASPNYRTNIGALWIEAKLI